MTYVLSPHPDHRPTNVMSVRVRLGSGPGNFIMLTYIVEPADSLKLPQHGDGRQDGLWHSTCFEMFLKTLDGPGYREFNFAPPFAWNAYAFADWRKGMKELPLDDNPHLVDSRLDDRKTLFPARYELDVVLGSEVSSVLPAKLSLAAVIEERSGAKSYWALAHPPGKPDFHHPACFTAILPPIALA